MTGSTYTSQEWTNVQANAVSPFAIGVTATATAGTSTVKNYVLTDDVFIRGVEFLTDTNVQFGDTVSIQVIDTNGITGLPAGTVLNTPISNWNLETVQRKVSYDSVTPQKGLATFTVSITYTSTGLFSVNFAANFLFLKILF